jgi:hypothetical protein
MLLDFGPILYRFWIEAADAVHPQTFLKRYSMNSDGAEYRVMCVEPTATEASAIKVTGALH